jgi:serine/threonine protein kinase
VVQKLTDYVWTGGNPYDDRELESVVRLFKALSVGLQDLKTFYGNLSAAAAGDPDIQRLFPFPRSYPDSLGQEVAFQYIKRLSMTKAVYLAVTNSGYQLIVKFVQRYNSDAHRLLASHDSAPMLHYSGLDNANSNTMGGLGVMIMDFVQGSDAYVLYSKTQLPRAIYDKVKQAISILHTESIVFADLRLPNILITEKETPMLVDFDWCGKHGIGRYPSSLNDLSSIEWHEGAVRNGIMYMEHDTFMLEGIDVR